MGDFNVILAAREKKGGSPFQYREALEFQNFISDNSLLNAGFSRVLFTWCNNRAPSARIWKRLDRALINHLWTKLGVISSVLHLPRTGSDHAPLLVSHYLQNPHKHSFKFLNFWTTHQEFLEEVDKIWKEEVYATPLKKVDL